MIELLITISELQTLLEGATALNIYLLHKLGGQQTIEKDEFQRVLKEFSTLGFSAKDDTIYVKVEFAKAQAEA